MIRKMIRNLTLNLSMLLTVAVVDLYATNDPAQSLRESYLGAGGLPSEQAYLERHGLAPTPGSESYRWQAQFKFTYRSKDLEALGDAVPLATDCYFTRTRTYTAESRAMPVWDGRVFSDGKNLVVAAYSRGGEQIVGQIVEGEVSVTGRSVDDSRRPPLLDQKNVRYNPFSGRLWRPASGGTITEEQQFFLPLPLIDAQGRVVRPTFEILPRGGTRFELVAKNAASEIILARCELRDAKRRPGYSPQLGPGCVQLTSDDVTILEVEGQLVTSELLATGDRLILKSSQPDGQPVERPLAIDGDFSEWRNVAGINDPRGDIPGYLEYSPDTDLLEFKVRHDRQHLYFYTRVAGRHGNTEPGNERDRYYYYVYIDADRDPTTGYLPTRDDDCYYGVTLGDDCEAQFEFVAGRFVKTFFGFTGAGTERDVLSGRVKLAPSWYSRRDPDGNVRDRYKVEYVQQDGELSITKDYQEGTSEDITIAVSLDGTECEMRASLDGFLRDASGKPIIGLGQRIDLAVGVEAAGRVHGNASWGADSTVAIRGYSISARP